MHADVVVIGAGHNGLVAALRLAKAGLSVAVVEASSSVGGCAATTEPLLAGFRHSPHANALMFTDVMPADFAPAGLKVRTHYPAAQLGVAFEDGRPPVILHRPDLLSRTKKCLSVYSAKDASAYVDLKRRSAALTGFLREGLYAAADPRWFDAQAKATKTTFSAYCDVGSLGKSSARGLIDALFESSEVRMLLYSLAIETGVGLEEIGSDLAFLSYSLWIAGRWRIPIGGMQSYANALYAAARAADIAVLLSRKVVRVEVEGGRAVGVELSNGEKIRASDAVMAATPILEIFDDLLDTEEISQDEIQELDAFRRSEPGSIASSVYCLEQSPDYKSAQHDTDINACLKTVVGHDSPSDLINQQVDISRGLLPKPAGVVRVHSLWDPSLAPAGCHVAGVDSSFPALTMMDHETWRQIEGSFPEALQSTWAASCCGDHLPILEGTTEVSDRFERRMLLRSGTHQYRTSVAGLYLGGPGVYPGGGVHGACGLNAAEVTLEDVKSRKHERVRQRGGS